MRSQTDLFDGRPTAVLREAPYALRSKTSREAAAIARPRARPQRQRVLEYLEQQGARGATRHEIAEALRIPLSSVCGRIDELHQLGTVIDTGIERETPYGKMASVWRLR